jgi:hypothetical protein
MRCICCRREVEYHRQVRELETGLVLGGLCAPCERERVGRLHEQSGPEDRSCGLCAHSGTYALPEHELVLDGRGPEARPREGYFVTEDTPRLCSGHLSLLAGHGRAATAHDGVEARHSHEDG